MNEMTEKYLDLKLKALELMQQGKISAYLSKLHEMNSLWLQMIQVRMSH
jgi:hypothetical protein